MNDQKDHSPPGEMWPLQIEEEMGDVGMSNSSQQNDSSFDTEGLSVSDRLRMLRKSSPRNISLLVICLLAVPAWMAFTSTFLQVMDETADDTRSVEDRYINIPLSNVGQHIPSLSVENTLNQQGHYLHDPYRSPYSSFLYSRGTAPANIKTYEDLDVWRKKQEDKEQHEFEIRLNQTRKQFGTWNFVDPYIAKQHGDYVSRLPVITWEDCPLRDCTISTSPSGVSKIKKGAWQGDEDYVGLFFDQANKLIRRVKESIYQEYSMGSYQKDNPKRMKPLDQLKLRDQIFRVIVTDDDKKTTVNKNNTLIDEKTREPLLGVAHISRRAWDALIAKLLHAIITNDAFFVVNLGDGNAAGHGNNFFHSPLMQFHYLMEPVMDLLGVRLVSRNMAQRDRSVLYHAMGGADLTGETDLLWVSTHYGPDRESDGIQDFVYKQAILGGERVPVILTNSVPTSRVIRQHAWVGSLQENNQYICKENKKGTVCDFDLHKSVCWVDRIDHKPQTIRPQDKHVPDEDKYPGYLQHQLEGRKLSIFMLEALKAAFDLWEKGIESHGFPLVESYWHVKDRYNDLRERVRTFSEPDYISPCEAMMIGKNADEKRGFTAEICRMQMHAYTEWTPRASPYLSSLKAAVSSDMFVSNFYAMSEYLGIDLIPQSWKVPANRIDSHLVAISTNASWMNALAENHLEEDQYFTMDDDGSLLDELGDPKRRRLAAAAELSPIQNKPNDQKTEQRKLNVRHSSEPLAPGFGWTMHEVPPGFCDGSSQATCNRHKNSTCLLAGHNDHTNGGILGDALSGWLKLTIPNVRQGLIMARFELHGNNQKTPSFSNPATVELTKDSQERRHLSEDRELPSDFVFEYTVDGGKTITSLDKKEFKQWGMKIADDMVLYPLLNLLPEKTEERRKNKAAAKNGTAGQEEQLVAVDYEVGMRIQTTKEVNGKKSLDNARQATLLLTHIYFA